MALRGVTQLLNLLTNLVLARILFPEDFGIVALAAAYVAVVEGLTLLPMDQALIRFRDPSRSLYDTAWTLSALRGAVIAAAMVASAAPASILMAEDRLEAVVVVLALKPLIAGIQNPRFIDFEKSLVFSKSFLLHVGTKAVMAAVTIGFAVALRSYWALIIGQLAAAAVQVVWSFVLKPFRPRFGMTGVRALFAFSAWLWGTSILRTLNLQADKFLIGAMLSTSAVGLYYLGTTLSETLIGSLTSPLVRALYPGFALIADQLDKLRKNVLEASSVVAAIVLPLGMGVALIAEEFVQVVLGDRWVATIPIIEVLVPLFALSSLTSVTDPVVMARGRTRLLFYRACAMLVIRVGAIVPGIVYFGLMGAVYGWAASHVAYLAAQLLLLARILGIRAYTPVVRIGRTWASLAFMTLSVVAVEYVAPAPDGVGDLLLVMGAKIAVGGIAYCAAHGGLWIAAGRPVGVETRILRLAGGLAPRILSS
ncbi:MAG: oligosaccharide flippase family protein [Gammaproteobacteria bacterium]|nr:oligosaccharide flippase family protein [Gammaproteobacteria bacterium]